MSRPYKCPVCNGAGEVRRRTPNDGRGTFDLTQCDPHKTCHGCDGKGWVRVGVEYPPALDPTVVQPMYQYDIHAS